MRSPSTALTLAGFALLACNAILGNESDYSLAEPGNEAGAPTSGGTRPNPGTAGASARAGSDAAGGMSEGGGSNGGSAGEGNAAGTNDPVGGEGGTTGACEAPSYCAPAPAGSDLGFVTADVGQSCPAGYSEVMLHSGLTSDGPCLGCSCVPKASRCDSSIVGHGAFPCPGFQTSGNSYNVFTTGCSAIAPGASVHFYDVRGFAECTPQGVGTPAEARWTETLKFCKLNQVTNGGCPAGSRCVAAPTEPSCALLKNDAACGAAYPNQHPEPLSTDFDDQRSCGECQCSFGSSACTGGKIQIFQNAGCTGQMVELGPAQGDACPLPFEPASGLVVGTPASTSCEPNTYPNGTLEPVDSRTLCCK